MKSETIKTEWTLYFAEDETVRAWDGNPVSPAELENFGAQSVPAQVPGSFETDFMRAGKISDPFFGKNGLKLRSFEYFHFYYTTEFSCISGSGDEMSLLFEGIDTFAEVYLNGTLIGKADNMFIPHSFSAKTLRRGKNQLLVHILPAVLEARKNEYCLLNLAIKYNYDSLFVRKSASMYGWDIAPRMISAGIWRPVKLVRQPKFEIRQADLHTISLEKNHAYLNLFYELELGREPAENFTLTMEARCGNRKIKTSTDVWGKCGKVQIHVDDPALWWPKGQGEQNLYDVRVTLYRGGEAADEKAFRTGIRTVELKRSSVVKDGKGEFSFIINGRPVFILGTNWVSPDSLPARADLRAPEILEMVDDIGCNAIRIWGGSHYESEDFYSLCDEKGILIWHDFMMACGNYPQTPEFISRLEREVTVMIRLLRHHPSIMLWCGDNECDYNYQHQVNFTNPNNNILTRETLFRVVLQEDFTRPYLPSSPYIDEECYKQGSALATEDHLWGKRDYFRNDYYVNSPALFASEIGYHGCPSPESLRKFISPEKLWPCDNDEWLFHASSPVIKKDEPFAYRIELMQNQVKILFGELPEELEMFALLDQISQAEAKKYFIERFRIEKGRKTGIIWWNICDGWPQISDAVVDYYYCKKLAYHYIKNSQQPLCLMMSEPENGARRLVAVNDFLDEREIEYRVLDGVSGRELVSGKAAARADSATLLERIEESGVFIYIIEWKHDGKKYQNHHLQNIIPADSKVYLETAVKYNLLKPEGFRHIRTCCNESRAVV